MDMSDGSLLERWRNQGDPDAFRDLVVRYGGLVFGTCRRVLGNAADAEDVTQECFLRLARESRRLKGPLGGWLHRVATHCAIDRLRSERRRQAREESYAASHSDTTEPQWDEVQIHIDQAIAQLPDSLREPLVRHFLQGHSHEAIGRDLGVTRSAVSHRIAQGIDTVRDSLRRKGVVVAPPALAAMLAANLAEATPLTPALTAALGRIAVSGIAEAGAGGIMAGMLMTKTAGVLLALLVAASAYVWWRQEASAPLQLPGTAATAQAMKPPKADAKEKPISDRAAPAAPQQEPVMPVNENRVRASVRLEDGGGVPGARVIAKGEGWTREAVSGADGTYELSLPLGECRIVCEPPEGFVTTLPDESHDWGYTKKFERVIDGYASDGAMAFHLRQAVNVWGRVKDANGKGIAGATVRFYYGDDPHTKTDKDGRFRLRPVPYGSVDLLALADGYAVTLVEKWTDGKDIRDVEFTLAPEAVLSGRVVDEDGAELPHAYVQCTVSTGPDEDDHVMLPKVETNEEGRFIVSNIPAGSSRFYVSLPTGEKTQQTIYPKNKPVPIDIGQVLSDVELVVPSAAKAVAGYVRDGVGNAIAEAAIMLDSQGIVAKTKQDGSFRIEHLDKEKVNLYMSRRGQDYVEVKDVDVGTEDLDIVLASGRIEGRVLDAATGEPLRDFEVRVADISPEGDRRRAVYAVARPTEEKPGEFSLDGIVAGVATVWASAPGHAPQRIDSVRIGSSHPAQLEFRLPVGGAVEGQIGIDGAMRSIWGSAEVSIAPKGHLRWPERIDRSISMEPKGGPYRFDLAEGDYQIAVTSYLDGPTGTRFYTWRGRFSVVAGESTKLDVNLGGPCVLRAQVRIPAEQGNYSTFLALREGSAPDLPLGKIEDRSGLTTDEVVREQSDTGVYEWPHLPAGTYKVTGTVVKYDDKPRTIRDATKTVTLTPGQSAEVYLEP